MPNAQLAVWRNGGSSPAESFVGNWTFVARMKGSGSRRTDTPQVARCSRSDESVVEKEWCRLKIISKSGKNRNFICYSLKSYIFALK
jgi:hypothetical protein